MRQPIIQLSNRRDSGEHAGLLLQRYLAKAATGENGDPDEKRALLEAAMAASRASSCVSMYERAYTRWRDSLPAGTESVILRTEQRLIVGLGSENVLETGLTLHHTYGMPVIPGSALKGLAAHYCDQVWGRTDPRFKKPSNEENEAYRKYLKGEGPKPPENFHRLLFGTTDDSGCVVFHDAWFVPGSDPQPLRLDVMTPHHKDYNRDPGDDKFAAPTDFDSPNPVAFLSVQGEFHVAVSWNGPPSDQSAAWTALALELLRQALEQWGVGGKTSSGYGRLVKADGSGPGPHSSAATAAARPTAAPLKRDDRVRITRTEQTTKRGAPIFVTEDGQKGIFTGEQPPDIAVGESTEAWIANVGSLLTFTLKEPRQRGTPRRRRG